MHALGVRVIVIIMAEAVQHAMDNVQHDLPEHIMPASRRLPGGDAQPDGEVGIQACVGVDVIDETRLAGGHRVLVSLAREDLVDVVGALIDFINANVILILQPVEREHIRRLRNAAELLMQGGHGVIIEQTNAEPPVPYPEFRRRPLHRRRERSDIEPGGHLAGGGVVHLKVQVEAEQFGCRRRAVNAIAIGGIVAGPERAGGGVGLRRGFGRLGGGAG